MRCPFCRFKNLVPVFESDDTVRCSNCSSVFLVETPRKNQADDDLPDVLPADEVEVLSVLPAETPPRQTSESLASRAVQGSAGWALKKVLVKVIVLILFIPLGGMALIFIALVERMPLHGSEPVPRDIACAKLLADGPGDNFHIALTDFKLDLNGRMWDSILGEPAATKVWVKVEPAGNNLQPGPTRILLETDQLSGPAALAQLQIRGRIEGMLRRGTSSVKLRETLRLQAKFPQTDWGNCWILRHGDEPPSPWATYALIVLGIVLILAGVPIWRIALAARQATMRDS